MYTISQLKQGVTEPSSAYKEVTRITGKYLNSYRGIKFMKEDWDNLILLDGCRFDAFENHNTISGDLQSKLSNASGTPEFLTKKILKVESSVTQFTQARIRI